MTYYTNTRIFQCFREIQVLCDLYHVGVPEQIIGYQ
jgi:hypothetical protein